MLKCNQAEIVVFVLRSKNHVLLIGEIGLAAALPLLVVDGLQTFQDAATPSVVGSSVGLIHHRQHILHLAMEAVALTVGETVGQGEVFGTVEAVKTVSDLNMPVTGEVLEINEELDAAPELVNNDPYGKGWIIRIAVKDAAELDSLMDAAAYQASL